MAGQEALRDLEELRELQSIAKRPHVLTLISAEIRSLEDKLSEGMVTMTGPTKEVISPISTAVRVPLKLNTSVNFDTLASFSWEQDADKVKLYIPLEGVDPEKMEAEFSTISFDVKFLNVGGKNYRCAIPKLNKDIVPDKCKVLVKPTRVVITLVKAAKGSWFDLHYKEDKLKPGLDKERDPMAGIMDLMKNMYDEGDEEMKRTIAKAWTDARTGKSGDPLKGFK